MAHTASDEEIIVWLKTKLDQPQLTNQLKALELEVNKVQEAYGKANLARIKAIVDANNKVIANTQRQAEREAEIYGRANMSRIAATIDANNKIIADAQRRALKEAEIIGKANMARINAEITANEKVALSNARKSDTAKAQALKEAEIIGRANMARINAAIDANNKIIADGERKSAAIKAQALKEAEVLGRANMSRINAEITANEKAAAEARRARSKTMVGAMENGTTFGHKVYTTASYMSAGMGIMALTSTISGMTSAFLEADKAQNKFIGILGLTKKEAQGLEEQLQSVSVRYGGQVTDLNEVALALGRAGVANNKLAEATQVVSQVALASGESFNTVTDLLVSWQTVYPEKTFKRLADEITTASNASKASIADFNTMSTYLLTAAKQAGVTSEMALSLGASLTQVGLGSSTAGTELRRFFNQLSTGSKDVRKVFNALGIDLKQFKAELAKGGKSADDAMLSFMTKMADTAKTGVPEAIDAISAVLDKATLKALKAASVVGEDGKSVLSRIFEEVSLNADNAAKKAADTVAGSFSVLGERIRNAVYKGAVGAGSDMVTTIFGSTNPEETARRIDGLTESTKVFLEVVAGATAIALVWKGVTSLYSAYIGLATVLPKVRDAILAYTTVTKIAGEASLVTAGSIDIMLIRMGAALGAISNLLTKYKYMKNLLAGGLLFAATDLGGAEDDPAAEARRKNKAADDAGRAKALLDNINKQKEAYKTLNAMHATNAKTEKELYNQKLKMQESINSKVATYNKLIAKKEVPTGKPVEDQITGTTPPNITDKDISKAKRIAKQNLDDNLALIRLRESEYFLNNNIESQLVQKQYHIANTLALELKALEGAGSYDNKQEDIRKKKREIVTATIEMQAASTKSTEEYNKQLVALGYQLALVGQLSDREKLSISNEQKLNEFTVERDKKLKEARSIIETDLASQSLKTKLVREANDTYAIQVGLQKAISDEQKRQIELAKTQRDNATAITRTQLEGQGARIASEAILSEKKALGLKLENDRLKVIDQYKTLDDTTGMENELKNLQLAYELDLKRIQGAETYNDLLMESNKTFERNNSEAQRFMRVTEGGISALTSGLSTFFDKTSSGYLNLSTLTENLTRALIKGLWDELVVNQIILQVRRQIAATNTSSSGGGTNWVSLIGSIFGASSGASSGASTSSTYGLSSSYDYTSMSSSNPMGSGGAWAKGGVSFNDNPTYLANGGSYVNSLVKKPTYVANGTIAGESGAEAVMPLQRDSQGRLGVISSGSGVQGVQNVQVQIVNQSGEELKVTKSESQFDGENFVLSVVLDAINRNKSGMRDAIKGTK